MSTKKFTSDEVEHNLTQTKKGLYSNLLKRYKELATINGIVSAKKWANVVPNIALKFRNIQNGGVGRVCVFDTETTGIGTDDEIVELSIVDYNDYNNLFYDCTYKPTKPISTASEAVHGIGNKDVENCPSWSEEHFKIQEYFNQYNLCIAYNSSFDERLIKQTDYIHSTPATTLPEVYDVLKDISTFIGIWDKKYFGYRWTKLEGGHRALGDCQKLIEVMNQISMLDIEKYNETFKGILC